MVSGFIRSESYSRGLFFSLLFNIVARLGGFAASLVIGFYFGAGKGADIYFYALGVMLLVSGFAVALDGAAIIPEMMRLSAQKGKPDAMRFANGFLYLYAAIGALIWLAAAVYPAEIFSALSRFDAAALKENADVLRLAGAALAFSIVNTYLADIASANKFFTMPMISNVALNLSVIASVLFFGKAGVSAAMGGLAIGGALQLSLLAALLRRHAGWKFFPADFSLDKRVFSNIFYSQTGNFAALAASYLPLYLLSGCGAGAVSAMNYARQPADMPHLALTNQFSSVAGIKFNEAAARSASRAELNPVFTRAAKILIFALTAAAVYICAFSGEIMRALYLRGKLTPEAADMAAGFLAILALSIPFVAFNTLAARLNMAFGRLREAMWFQIISNACAAAIFAVCIPRWGARGYALGFVVFGAANTAGLWLYFRKIYPEMDYTGAVKYFARVAAAMAAALVIALPVKFIPGRPVVIAIAGFAVFCAAALAVNRYYGLNPDADNAFKSLLRWKLEI